MKSKLIPFDLETGKIPENIQDSLKRHLSDLAGIFADTDALKTMAGEDDRLVYEFYDMGMPETEGDLAFGTSIVYPGLVGQEFFMTKGHFHTILDTAEVYYCLSGHGVMMMEDPEGHVEYQEMRPGEAVYVPGKFAHRSINISRDQKLVTFYVFRADAGHDYGTIEQKGFRKLVVEHGDSYAVVDNPRWGENT